MSRLLIATAVALLASATLASADPAPTRRDVQVSYADLDLNTEQGAATMLARIEKAAERACSHSPLWRNPDEPRVGALLREIRLCQEQSVSTAVAGLSAPKVTAAYGARQRATRLTHR